ncbi:AAA domain-containing protein [Nocardia sp. ET3-3]|uniref:AAA domain-containing protein n=1 Tax=Nocardia terrae TaxID=2675851 RepID=A0A7K1US17_9NOCA|nr:AAA family ATPase [Nocardia terrae]MVU77117.1 AAA domain-containing protein [Nocardia terrae]
MTAPAPISAPAPAAAASTAPAPVTAGARLGNGELRRMVARVLADEPATEFSPRDISNRTGGRSSGAIGNALDVLVAAGHADRTQDKPRRYRANADTAAAAGTAPTPATPPAPAAPRRRKTAPATPATAAAPTPAVPVPAPAGAPVTRPNGQLYHPRTLAGLPDVEVLARMRTAGVPVLLYGPPGTGKTSLIEAAYPDLFTVQGDGDTTVADFVGEYTQTPDGRFEFVHGPLVRAMRAGAVLFIDDATLIPPSVLAVVYPAMDGRREIVVKANGGEVVTAAPGFFVVAGHNPGVHGAILSDALASRFAFQVEVSSDYELAESLGVDSRAVRVARALATRVSKGEIGWAPQLRELLAFAKIAAAVDIPTAAANMIGTAPEDDRAIVAAQVGTTFGRAFAPLALGTRIRP